MSVYQGLTYIEHVKHSKLYTICEYIYYTCLCGASKEIEPERDMVLPFNRVDTYAPG